MAINRTILLSAIAGTVALAGAVYAQGANNEKELAAAVQEVKQIEAKLANGGESADIYADNVVDIHSSGWSYTKAENLAISRNLRKIPGKAKVIKTIKSEERMFALNKDTVVETSMSTTYYEVPNPQDLARAEGTLTFEPDVVEKTDRNRAVPGPGDDHSFNPNRNRQTRVWARINGRWQIAVSVGSTVRNRTIPGRL